MTTPVMITTMSKRWYLVRHAMPVVEASIASPEWVLDTAGRRAARELADSIPAGPHHWVASNEPKSWQTLEQMAAVHRCEAVHRDAGFGEVAKPANFVPDHRALAGAYVDGTVHPGWEPHDAVVARFEAAIMRHAEQAGEADLVVGTHGMALTTWLATRIDLGNRGQFWRGLALPDVIVLDPPHTG